MQATRLEQYLKALDKLEQYRLVSVDRSTKHYTGWIIKEPTGT